MRFGIGDRIDRTLEQVGQEFYVTRERIRQIEAQRAQETAPSFAAEAARPALGGLETSAEMIGRRGISTLHAPLYSASSMIAAAEA